MNTITERLEKAYQLEKYGHLETWYELFAYQLFASKKSNGKQVREIAGWAKRKNMGENVTLPLKDYVYQQELL